MYGESGGWVDLPGNNPRLTDRRRRASLLLDAMGKKKGKGGGGGAAAPAQSPADDAEVEEAPEPETEAKTEQAAAAVDVTDEATPTPPMAPTAESDATDEGEVATVRDTALVKGTSETRHIPFVLYCEGVGRARKRFVCSTVSECHL